MSDINYFKQKFNQNLTSNNSAKNTTYDNTTSGLSATNVQGAIDLNNALGKESLSIAKGKNQARIFNTTTDMQTWLSNVDNKGICNVGDNLYIVDVDVPDYWISEVLETSDGDTGYYYKIAQLETQKVDLTTINKAISDLQTSVANSSLEWKKITVTGTTAIDLSALDYSEICIDVAHQYNTSNTYYSKNCNANSYGKYNFRKCDLSNTNITTTIYSINNTGSYGAVCYSNYSLNKNKLQLIETSFNSDISSVYNSYTTTILYYR